MILQTLGCGDSIEQSNIAAPVIATQPANQTIPLTQTATFTVVVSGSAPLTYQWKENGTAIPGATSASYTTGAVSYADNAAAFTVTVSNSAGVISSSPATLTVGARSPKPGDLRFKLVDYAPSLTSVLTSNIVGNSSYSATNVLGTPLEVGSAGDCGPGIANCGWHFFLYNLPTGVTGINTTYTGGNFATLAADLASLANSSIIVTTLDEQPANSVYAISYLTVTGSSNQPSGFSQAFHSAALTNLQTLSAQEGAQSRVITAVSYNPLTGLADYLSYGWQSDTTTLYETKVVISSFSSVESDAASLAADGYIVSATGSGPNNGFILVGTRVQGDTLPRGFQSEAFPNPGSSFTTAVALIFDSNGNSFFAEN